MIDAEKMTALEELMLGCHALEWARADAAAELCAGLSPAEVRGVAELLGVGHRTLENWVRLSGCKIRPADQAPWSAAHQVNIFAKERA